MNLVNLDTHLYARLRDAIDGLYREQVSNDRASQPDKARTAAMGIFVLLRAAIQPLSRVQSADPVERANAEQLIERWRKRGCPKIYPIGPEEG